MHAITKLLRRFTYPNNQGQPIRRDPSHGRIDRDIQWRVQDWYQPRTVAQRVVMEGNLQQQRERGGGR